LNDLVRETHGIESCLKTLSNESMQIPAMKWIQKPNGVMSYERCWEPLDTISLKAEYAVYAVRWGFINFVDANNSPVPSSIIEIDKQFDWLAGKLGLDKETIDATKNIITGTYSENNSNEHEIITYCRKYLFALTITLTVLNLAACVTPGQLRKDRLAMAEECVAQGHKKRTVAYAKCLNKKIEKKLIEINYPYFDLADLSAAYRVYLAEKYETGELSEAEAELAWADFKTKLAAEEQKRARDAAYARAAAARGNAALLQSWGIMLDAMQPKQVTPSGVTCVQQGSFTNCNYR